MKLLTNDGFWPLADVHYGIAILLVGVLVSFVAPVMHVNAGEWTIDETAAFLPIPLVSLLKVPLGTTGFWLGFGGRIIESLS